MQRTAPPLQMNEVFAFKGCVDSWVDLHTYTHTQLYTYTSVYLKTKAQVKAVKSRMTGKDMKEFP